MVKNTTGGNKHKGQARKFVNARPSNKLRISEDEAEVYGQVTKLLGNGMCHVNTLDGTKMLCIIRGKFRGRGKRDNILKTGTWILVGIREWEEKKDATTSTLLNKCDLLEVYSDLDKEKLKSTVNLNWRPFIDNDATNHFTDKEDEDLFQFSNEEQEEYKKIMEDQVGGSINKVTLQLSAVEEEEEINIDDI